MAVAQATADAEAALRVTQAVAAALISAADGSHRHVKEADATVAAEVAAAPAQAATLSPKGECTLMMRCHACCHVAIDKDNFEFMSMLNADTKYTPFSS